MTTGGMKMKALISTAALAGIVIFLAGTASGQQTKIGMKRAQAIATSHARGLKLKAKELEHENGTWIYSFEFREKNGNTREVNVNAYSGKVAIEHETKKSEANEEKGEKH
jgi:uncharacterized membrane protein YkoI